MKKVELAVVGAGPAGLSAAIEAAKHGVKTLVLDENRSAGGQLFKQIHKFFGSRRQMSGTRGFEIGKQLLNSAQSNNVELLLNSQVIGIDRNRTLAVLQDNVYEEIAADTIILCCGATEKALAFPGWTLPGVMGAGAAQTLVNIHRVLPGKKILMVGSGNVGLIVTYHLLLAGAKVAAIIDASSKITGYGVHAAKVRRQGVPFLLGYTINRALGENQVESAELIKVDRKHRKIPGSEKAIDADTICLAVGLSPSIELASMQGCNFKYNSRLGGYIPQVDDFMQTSSKDIYAAGDITGIEEASIAMEEGKLAGLACAIRLGYCDKNDDHIRKLLDTTKEQLTNLRKRRDLSVEKRIEV